MRPGRPAPARCGLTLIELLLAMTILAIAGALVSGSLGTGLRAWQSGLHHGREELVARIVVERLAAQLRSAVDATALRGSEETAAFDASTSSLRFVTIAGAGGEPVQVSYALEGDAGGRRLVYREHPWPDKDFFGTSLPRREEAVPEVVGLSVTANRRAEPPGGDAGAGSLVPESWDPADQRLPASVALTIDVAAAGGAEPRRYSIVVPLLMAGEP